MYKLLDPTGRQPSRIDSLWNSSSLSYVLEPGASAPRTVFLELCDGAPNAPAMETHFYINLSRMVIRNNFESRSIRAPSGIAKDMLDLRDHVLHYIRNERREERNRRLTAERTKKEAAEEKRFQVS